MIKSGSFFATASNGVVVYQPCFDTFTEAYESDGEWMETITSGDAGFVAWRDGLRRFGYATSLSGNGDHGTDGVGIDAIEYETSPPIPYKMPSIQATIVVCS